MSNWNPETYLKFGGERLRPALDLLGQITLDRPRHILDLGCGPGNVTHILQTRWPDAHICGIDSSKDMLTKAAHDYPDLDWQQGDISNLAFDHRVDLIFSNACLHWLKNHNDLFNRLFDNLNEGGILAVQMPNNFAEPTHQAIGDILGHEHPLCPGYPVNDPSDYYDWLAPSARHINIWETRYLHILDGDNPVADWTKGAALRPILQGLENDQARAEFEQAYSTKIAKAYPKSDDGKTILPFKRFFLIAQK